MKTSPPETNNKFNKTPPTQIKSQAFYSSPKEQHDESMQSSNLQNIYKKLSFKDDRTNGQARSLLKQSNRRVASSISMTDFFKENIENRDAQSSAYVKILNSASKTEQLQIIHNEHRIEVEKLLLQISRLHDVIYDVERSKKYQLQRLKQEYEQMTYLHLSNLKQSQFSQLQILQVQLKKTRQALDEKCMQNEELERTSAKERQMFKNQITTLRNNLKQVVNKKNEQIFQIEVQTQQKLKNVSKNNSAAIQQMKQSCDRQIKKIQKQLQQKQLKLSNIQQDYNRKQQKNSSLQQELEKEKFQLQEKLQNYIEQYSRRYEVLTQHIHKVLKDRDEAQDGKEAFLKQVYENEIKKLLTIIKVKDNENVRVQTHLQSQRVQNKYLLKNAEDENEYLRKLLHKTQELSLQQIEKLKSKMALLHENDINQLVKLYQTKIQNLNQQLDRQNKETVRLRDYMHEQTHRWFENKKHYEHTISKLNVEILRLRNGLGSMEKDMKQRLDNERSALLLTSQNLIRGAELKNTNALFYEEEARKLRLTIQKLERQFDENQKQLKAQINKLKEQIRSMTELNKIAQAEFSRAEQQKLRQLQQKQNEIKRLNRITRQLIQQNKSDEQRKIMQLKLNLEQLNKLLLEKNDKIKQLNSKIEKFERDVQQLKIENEQLYLQNQINHEQAKNQYQKIANSNIKSLKQFYERRIDELESDKAQYKIKQSADQANITQLIRRYQLLEDYVKKLLKQSKKRTQLEERIIHLGMDNNLVKNKAILFAEQQYE